LPGIDASTHSAAHADLGVRRRRSFWLFTRLAIQNLGRRPTRTSLLVLAVALGTGAVFASLTVAEGIRASVEVGFSRMGADLIVVPQETLVNITSALLTVQPTDATFDASVIDQISAIAGVARTEPQRVFSVPVMAGMPNHRVNLIAFDPARDFTVTPWVVVDSDRPIHTGDLLSGARRNEKIGDEPEFCGTSAAVTAQLGRTGVGPFDESLFTTFATIEQIAKHAGASVAVCLPHYVPGKLSAVLVRLKVGATVEQVRFAIARIAGVKVLSGASIMTSNRQSVTALFAGVAAFTALMLASLMILVSLLFSAIIAERQREIGLLKAVGARGWQVVRMLLAEAGFTTGLGGICGIALGGGCLFAFQRSLGYYLETLQILFIWPTARTIAIFALGCVAIASAVGVAGAIIPAFRASRRDPYLLIMSDGA
jgi:putative ABC transport system permease protein